MIRRFAPLLVLLLAATLHAAPFEVRVEKDVMVAMRDGVKLATDIYLPVKDGKVVSDKLPTILTRLPYNKDGGKTAGNYFASHGYAFVAQDTRGRYKSEGVWHMLIDDGPDGVDCLNWIAQQPWSDGKVGMIGTSYVGGTQHAVALLKPEPLVTVIPVDAMSNIGRQSLRNAGAFELRFWNWIFLNAGRGSRAARDPGAAAALKEMAENRWSYLQSMPTRRGMTPLRLAPEYEDWLVTALERGANDEFWSANNIVEHPERYKDMPVYLVGGWYDSWAGNTTANYMALSKAIRSDVYLIMGPWIHGMQHASAHGQVDFGKDAAIADQWAWRKTWFDRWMRGANNEVGSAAPFATKVRIFVMGSGDGRKTDKGHLYHGGSWRDEREWPLARTRYTNFYLQAGGDIGVNKPSASDGATSFTFDPRNPVPTIGGNISSGDGIMLQGAWNQKTGPHIWNDTRVMPLSARNDVLVFQTQPLQHDMEITGEIEVKLWVSSSATDTDFTAKLIDVYPPSTEFPEGFDLGIGDGIIRCRYRESLKSEKLMEPGKVYSVTIKLYPTSNIFKKGHRIRVDISSSNFPRFDVNPNTGEPLNQHRRVITAVNTVHHSAEHPSHIILPVIPPGR